MPNRTILSPRASGRRRIPRTIGDPMILLDGHSLTLEQLLAIADDRAEVALAPGAVARVSAARAVVDAKAAGDAPVYGINTGFGSFAEVQDRRASRSARCSSTCCAATRPASASRCRSAPCARRWRCAPTCWPTASPASALETLEALLALLNRGVHPARPEPRIGRRERRPRAARPPRARPHRRRRRRGTVASSAPAQKRCARAGLEPVAPRAEGGPGAHQRHAGLDRRAGAGARRRRAPGARRRRRRRALDRRAARVARARSTRASTPRGRIPARRHRPRTSAALLDGSAINASHANCGRVQDAYSMRCAAAGARRGPRGAALRPRTLSTDRSQRRHRQPDGLRRRRATSSRAATSTARRSRSPPTCWRSPSRSSRRSASGAPIAWSTRRSAACRRSSRATAACSRASCSRRSRPPRSRPS